jgi:hypothetical protein
VTLYRSPLPTRVPHLQRCLTSRAARRFNRVFRFEKKKLLCLLHA